MGSCNAGLTCVDFQGDDLPRCADCAAAAFICSGGERCVDDPVSGPRCEP